MEGFGEIVRADDVGVQVLEEDGGVEVFNFALTVVMPYQLITGIGNELLHT